MDRRRKVGPAIRAVQKNLHVTIAVAADPKIILRGGDEAFDAAFAKIVSAVAVTLQRMVMIRREHGLQADRATIVAAFALRHRFSR